jgi:hypothetical protein
VASASTDKRGLTERWLRRAVVFLLACWAAIAAAHPMPESQVWIDTAPAGLDLTLQLPLNRLEFAFGHNLTDDPATVLQRHGDALASYLLLHVGARSAGVGWQALRPRLRIVDASGPGGVPELEAQIVLRAPPGASVRELELLYDAITHEVHTHRVQVYLRNDWRGGFAGQPPQLLGQLDTARNAMYIRLPDAGTGAGIASLLLGGIAHIAEGTDHLLFLLLLVLVAPLTSQARRWHGMRPLRATLKHTLLVITAFTAGHTVTLVLGSTGLVTVPAGPVEVAVAATIALAALHAWRPLFARAEAWMALVFGLVHGLAFSASLSGAGLTPWQHAQALVAFNLGIEAMQLIALLAVLPPLLLAGHQRPEWFGRMRQVLAVLAGVMALAWVLERLGVADLSAVPWLRDGGAVPVAVAAVLWLAGLASLATTRQAARRP